jgi:hypothetical protein
MAYKSNTVTFLANNREALAGWDAAAKLTDLQVPERRQLKLETDGEGAVFANAIRAEYQF